MPMWLFWHHGLNIKKADDIFRKYTEDQQESWIKHSKNVAAVAQKIAKKSKLDEQRAYAYGLLHDIGRSRTKGQFQHIMYGYEMMMENGYDDIAKICLTHSFPIQNIYSYVGKLDVTQNEVEKYQKLLQNCVYDDYDRLIQLCDAISTDTGYVCIEKRFVDLVLKYGFNDFTIEKWKKTIEIKEYFERKTGTAI